MIFMVFTISNSTLGESLTLRINIPGFDEGATSNFIYQQMREISLLRKEEWTVTIDYLSPIIGQVHISEPVARALNISVSLLNTCNLSISAVYLEIDGVECYP